MSTKNIYGHGWTRIHTDKKETWFYLCESVSIRGQTCFAKLGSAGKVPAPRKLDEVRISLYSY
jgi:hypothetical protein